MRRKGAISAPAVSCLVAAMLVIQGCGGTAGPIRRLARDQQSPAGAPPFLVESLTRQGVALTLRSPRTGAVVRRFGRVRGAFTNNGLSVAPDQRSLYLTLIGRRTIWVDRLEAGRRRPQPIARGERPTLSPDGTLLAFFAGGSSSDTVAIRNLATGATRRVSLAPLLGRARPLFDALPAWVGGGTELVVIVPPPPVLTLAESPHEPARTSAAERGTCSALTAGTDCVILVGVPASGRLTATLSPSRLPGNWVDAVSTDGSVPDAVIVRSVLDGTIRRATVTGRTIELRTLARTRRFLLAVSPDGERVLYLRHASQIWLARLSDGRLRDARELVRPVRLGAAVW